MNDFLRRWGVSPVELLAVTATAGFLIALLSPRAAPSSLTSPQGRDPTGHCFS